jgi:hypothetical protein
MLIKSFVKLCQRMLSDWSQKEVDEGRKFESTPASPNLNTEVAAFHYLQKEENKEFISKQIVRDSYFVRGSMASNMQFSKWSRRYSHPSKLKSFAEFTVWSRAFYTVEKSTNGYFQCSCPMGMKKYVCKHTVAVNVLKNRYELKPLAKSLPFGFKRGRGRPKTVGPALSIE